MTVTSIHDLQKGDKVVIQTDENEVKVYTVKKVLLDDYLIWFEETYPLDYAPEDPEEIIILN